MGRLQTIALSSVALAAASLATVLAEREPATGSSMVLYRTRMAPGAAYGGYSYANYDGTDFRDFSLTTERRRMNLRVGRNTVRVAGLPATLDKSTVSLRSLTDPAGTSVLEQRFVYDLSDGERPLVRARGHEVLVRTEAGAARGVLVDFDRAQITLRTKDARFPLRMIQRRAVLDLQIAKTAGLITSPTLQWTIEAARAGPHDVELTYRAHQVSWAAAYTAIYDPSRERVDLSAHATLENKSGADVRGADVHLIHRSMKVSNFGYGAVATLASGPDAVQSFHLRRKVDVGHGQSVQLDLFPPLVGRKARTVLVYEATAPVAYTSYPNTECYSYAVAPTKKTSNRYLEIDPGDKKLAGSFPPGKARVYRRTAKGPLELVSEEHLLVDKARMLRIKVGGAHGLSASRKQLDCRHNEQARELREKVEITIANKSKRTADVVLREYMNRWPTWTIESASATGTESGGNAVEYRLALKAGASKTVTYTVVYNW